VLKSQLEFAPRSASRDGRYLLATDERASWKDVVRAVQEAADGGYQRAFFAFAVPSGFKMPSSPLDEDLARIRDVLDPAERAMKLTELIQKELTSCEPMLRAFARAASADAQDRARVLSEGYARGFEECGCKPGLERARAMFAVLAGREELVGAVDLKIDRAGGQLALPGEMLWKEASAKVRERAVLAAPTWLAVEGSVEPAPSP
jgi:hypothetical protein